MRDLHPASRTPKVQKRHPPKTLPSPLRRARNTMSTTMRTALPFTLVKALLTPTTTRTVRPPTMSQTRTTSAATTAPATASATGTLAAAATPPFTAATASSRTSWTAWLRCAAPATRSARAQGTASSTAATRTACASATPMRMETSASTRRLALQATTVAHDCAHPISLRLLFMLPYHRSLMFGKPLPSNVLRLDRAQVQIVGATGRFAFMHRLTNFTGARVVTLQ